MHDLNPIIPHIFNHVLTLHVFDSLKDIYFFLRKRRRKIYPLTFFYLYGWGKRKGIASYCKIDVRVLIGGTRGVKQKVKLIHCKS